MRHDVGRGVRAGRVGSDTLLGQIVNMVAEAQRSRAPIQGRADQVAGIFVPAVLAVAALTFVLWMWLGPEPKLAPATVIAGAAMSLSSVSVISNAVRLRNVRL